jgi:uncharacterized protein
MPSPLNTSRSHRPWARAIILGASLLVTTAVIGFGSKSSTASAENRGITVAPFEAKARSAAAPTTPKPKTTQPTATQPTATEPGTDALRLVAAARTQVGVTTGYDPSYVRLAYPGGDVPINTGVCTDVVIRGLRGLSIDLQERVHKDMAANFSKYPKLWGLKKPDTNIDHRRVPNLETYFTRRGYALPVSNDPADYKPGDIVTMRLPLAHIGIVSDRTTSDGRPLVIHNVGGGAQEEDVLFAWKLVGHYRVLRS